jgi:hypothetical protein
MNLWDPPVVRYVDQPVTGGLTALSSGTAVLDARQWLHQLESFGLTPRDLKEVAQAMEVAAREEEEHTAAMSKFRKNVTGVDNTIFFSAKFSRHKPRIKVAVDPPTHVDPSSDGNASVEIATGERLVGAEMPAWLEALDAELQRRQTKRDDAKDKQWAEQFEGDEIIANQVVL